MSPGDSERAGARVDAVRIIADLQQEVRERRRERLARPGGSTAYGDERVFAAVEQILRRALIERDRTVLLLPELLDGRDDLRLDLDLRISSHRPIVGPLLVFLKRRLLIPLTRWLYEYSAGNFRRQHEINLLLCACVEELAIEVARLRQEREETAARAGRLPPR